jgi:hypothetical protein
MRGIRQVDLLSHYLFILCAKTLTPSFGRLRIMMTFFSLMVQVTKVAKSI